MPIPDLGGLTTRLEHVLVWWRWTAAEVARSEAHPVSEDVGQAVVAGVRDLLPVLRERAQETEDARVVPADSVKALEETGFFRLLQPASYDGLEADPVTFLSAVRLIASACGSTG